MCLLVYMYVSVYVCLCLYVCACSVCVSVCECVRGSSWLRCLCVPDEDNECQATMDDSSVVCDPEASLCCCCWSLTRRPTSACRSLSACLSHSICLGYS